MNRHELIRRDFDKAMRLIELGPSYNPIIPKAEGWQTTIVDHASQADLVTQYRGLGVTTLDRIEPVDYIWQSGPLTELFPAALHGSFDGLVASHVGEHFPDLIAFFQSAAALVKPGGLLALALPDKRVCFDFFQPITMTGDVIDAHAKGRIRHSKRTFFNHAAYFTEREGAGGWVHHGETKQFQLKHSLFTAQKGYEDASEDPASAYQDTHAWTFTPKSFELIVLELNLLGHIDWAIRSVEPADGVEFYVWLERRRVTMPEADINPARLALLKDMVGETQDAIDQLAFAPATPVAAAWKAPPPSEGVSPDVAVIIPLYNGSRYIEEALNSVFRQSLPAAEIIVIDDGSTDNGAGVAIVERLARSHPLTLLRKPNGGQSSARNLGVSKSTSSLVAFLDQDDVWYESHLEELVKPFQAPTSPPLGWVYSDLDEIDESGYLVSRSYLATLSVPHPKRHIFDCMRQDMFILPSAAVIRRDAFEAVGGFDEQLCGYEDDDLFLRLFRAGYDNVFLSQALSKWRIYPGSTSYTFRMARSRGIYARKLLATFPDDVKRVRYYAKDLIIPRFFEQAVREHEAALKSGDAEAIAETWNEVTFLAEYDAKVAPKLFEHALVHYRSALMQGDNAGINAAWAEVAAVASRMPNKRLRVRAAVNLLRSPTISKSMFKLRNVARPAMRWALQH